jgi:hypothetical protein
MTMNAIASPNSRAEDRPQLTQRQLTITRIFLSFNHYTHKRTRIGVQTDRSRCHHGRRMIEERNGIMTEKGEVTMVVCMKISIPVR